MTDQTIIWYSKLISWFLLSLEFFLSKKIINFLNNIINKYALGSLELIKEDTIEAYKKGTKKIKHIRKVKYFIAYIPIAILLNNLLSFLPFNTMILTLLLFIGLLFSITLIMIAFSELVIEIFTEILTIFAAILLYPIYFFISKCPKGAIAGTGAIIQIIVLFVERP
ncbi:MAG: hypothetical protein BA863_01685 [Desulfovibrio sp. S3730MH75]|nr:MAG: hypothetical protein BA863_01685 [Desulfovibrio sp. S3730MH75]